MTMPTKEQMEEVAEHIRDVIGRNYIEGDGDQASCWFQPEGGGVVGRALFQGATIGTPEPFSDLPSKAKAELLVTCVDWEGFTLDERRDVSRRVIDGESPEFWMDGVTIGEVMGQTIAQVAEEERQGLHKDWMAEERDYHRPYAGPDEEIGSGSPEPEALQVRPLTEQLINAVLLDVWPSIPTIVDFGIDSDQHLGALQFAIKYGEVTPQELDAAMGDGAKLTEIVRRGDNPYRDVTFRTSWDEMRLEPPDETMGRDDPAPLANKLDHRGLTERILFGEILHSGPSAAPQPEKAPQAKSRDDGGIEM